MNRVIGSASEGWRDRLARGRALGHLRRHEEAELDLVRAIELAPDNVQALVERGSIYIESGQWEKAESDFERAAKPSRDGQQRWIMSQWWIAGPCEQDDAPPEIWGDPSGRVSPPDFAGRSSATNLRWRAQDTYVDGLLNVEERLTFGRARYAYALSYVRAAQDLDGELLLGPTDGLDLWFNGQVVHSSSVTRPVRPDQEAAPVRIQKGWNVLLAQVSKLHSRAAGLYVRFSEDSAKN
ncbi:MAG: tetratricopeptide repeat protein [Planctomycetota bacterium]